MTQINIKPEDIFECQQCGDCCTGYGGTYVTENDIRRIAEFINTSAETFQNDYCQISDGKPVLKIDSTGKCVFFSEATQCTIHPVKPRMCRAWPYIENILKAPGNWEIMSGACPGIKTGFSHDQVKECVKKELDKLNRSRKEAGEDQEN